ncbi:MAG TPA: SgcJ/EcaC family oxidoreductase [Pyrinomonadaceae bacterium]|nr:SgcJ/EcaC family oxidoreductase [Pyrinomonadaceae bacterium]
METRNSGLPQHGETFPARRGRLLCILLVIAASAFGSLSVRAADGRDEAAIRENVRQMETGWNTKSGAAFAKPFAADADYVVINGLHLRGLGAITQGHQQIFDTIYKNSTLSLSVKQIRMLRPDVAVVHVNATNKTQQGAQMQEAKAIITLVMTKEKGDWKIVAFQNTQVVG